MTTSRFPTRPPRDFVSTGAHHWPRTERGFLLLFLGSVTLWCGIYLISNDLPATSSDRAQITLQGLPTLLGGICVLFGVVGLVSGIRGSVRKGSDAIDLKPSARGLRVRGDRLIPWESISAVTDVQYWNRANLQLLWDRADLNRALILHLDEPLDVPRITVKEGEARLQIPLLRYPAVDYRPLYESLLEEFARRGVPSGPSGRRRRRSARSDAEDGHHLARARRDHERLLGVRERRVAAIRRRRSVGSDC